MSFGVRRTINLSVQEYEMTVSGKQAAAEINLDEFERRLRSPGSQQTSVEDLLAELPGQTDIEPRQPLEIATLQPVIDVEPDEPTRTASVDIEAQRSDETVATSSDAGATLRKDITQPAAVEGVTSEEPPIELGDHASLGNAPPAANLTPTLAGAAQSTAGASSGPPVSVVVNTPVVAPPFAAPPPAAPQLSDPKGLRTVSQRPDGTQIATATPSATDSGEAVQASDGPQPPAKPATKGASETAGVAQPPTHKLDLPTKLSRKPSARPVVAKTETAAPGPEADKAPETPIEPRAASEAPLVPAPKPVDPLSHAFSYIVGALGAPAASAPQPVDQTAAHKSGDWAIRFAAQKSEAEAKVNVAGFNAKYAAALNGATIGVNKTLVNGETIYALRVTGLSKAEAAALCERLKGRDCFMAK
jgi:sporulation related protein